MFLRTCGPDWKPGMPASSVMSQKFPCTPVGTPSPASKLPVVGGHFLIGHICNDGCFIVPPQFGSANVVLQ